MFLITSSIVINVPTRGLLAVETMYAIVQWLENLNIKRNMMSIFVNKKHSIAIQGSCVISQAVVVNILGCEQSMKPMIGKSIDDKY